MTLSSWRLTAIIALSMWAALLIVVVALVDGGFSQGNAYERALAGCYGTVDRQLELIHAGASSLGAAANAIDTASKLNYFLDEGIRLQLAAETLEKTHHEVAVEPHCMGD